MKSHEELEQGFRNFVAASGAELAGVLFQGSISKLAEEYWAIVSRSQKAQGEAEEATAAAQATRGAEEKKIIELRQTLTSLAEQLRDYEARLKPVKEEYGTLTVKVEALRAEAKQHAKKTMDIIANNGA